MKRVFLSIIATAALFVGCNADVDVEVTRPIAVNAPTFSASFDAETRTSYEENQGYAKWIENEHLSIFNLDNHNLKYYIHNVGNNGKTADMDYAEEYVEKSGDILDQNYAIYPYSEANEAANGIIYSEIPAVQTYDAESNFKNVPIVASSPDTSLSFSIPTAIYRYKVKKQNHPSKFILKSITMTSKSTNIAGAIEIDMTVEKPVAVVTGDGKSVTLDLGEGVEITTTEQYFYIALPATSFPENDRTITCLVSKGGKDYQVVIEKENEMTLEAGIVKSTSIELKATSFTANSVYPSTGGELVGTLTLTSDFTLEQPLTVPAGEEATVNLNGKNITAGLFAESNGAVTEGTTDSYAFWVKEGAKLTINGDGKVKTGACKYSMAVWAQGGEVEINGGYYENAGEGSDLIYASAGAKITINGGEFKACEKQDGVEGTQNKFSAMNIKDSDRATCEIVVKGGKFYGFDPANNVSEGVGTNFVADGYISVEVEENVWEVMPADQPIEVATAAALEDVLAQGGSAVLAANITLEQPLTVPAGEEAIVNLNGYNITNTSDSDIKYFDIFYVEEGATLTINGNGNVEAVSGNSGYCVFADGNVIINGGSYKSGKDANNYANACIYANYGHITINGGEFTSEGIYTINKDDEHKANSIIEVKGGKFYNFDPANNAADDPSENYVAEGYISVEVEENVWKVMPLTEAVPVTNANDLKSVLAAGGDVVLAADITLDEILVVSGNSTIDGNGKTFSSSAARAINVSGAQNAYIKNLTIKADGERAINIIQNSQNVTIEGVTATAANYTVNIASSAPNAVVTIKNSTLNGLCTVNVSAEKAKVTIDKSTVNCNDKNTTEGESYAALALNKEANGGSIIATDSTINVAEGSDSFKGRNSAEDGTVIINDSTDDVQVISTVITYEGSPYYHGLETLADAIDFAKDGNTITIIRNIVMDEPITVADKSITVDLNGHNITNDKGDVFVVTSDTLTINGEGVVYGSSDNSSSSCAVWAKENGKVVINGGTYKVGDDATGKTENGGNGNWRNDCIYARDNASITINGGKFQYTGENPVGHNFLLNLNDNSNASIVVNGGEFYKFNPASSNGENPTANFVAEGKTSTANGDWYIVK